MICHSKKSVFNKRAIFKWPFLFGNSRKYFGLVPKCVQELELKLKPAHLSTDFLPSFLEIIKRL
jgi:hypothetical protein